MYNSNITLHQMCYKEVLCKHCMQLLKSANQSKITRVCKEMRSIRKTDAYHRSRGGSPDFLLFPRLSEWAVLSSFQFSISWKSQLQCGSVPTAKAKYDLIQTEIATCLQRSLRENSSLSVLCWIDPALSCSVQVKDLPGVERKDHSETYPNAGSYSPELM